MKPNSEKTFDELMQDMAATLAEHDRLMNPGKYCPHCGQRKEISQQHCEPWDDSMEAYLNATQGE